MIEKAEGLGRNVTLLAEHVANMTYKHVEILQKVLEKVPEPAKIHIEHAMNVSIGGHERAVERILEQVKEKMERVEVINCTTDVDCWHLICPQVVGHDTPLCREGRCVCGGRWEINKTEWRWEINQTEWRERFKEEWVPEIEQRWEKIREMYNRTEIEERIKEIRGVVNF